MKKNVSFAVVLILLMLVPLSLASSPKPVAAKPTPPHVIYDSIPAPLPGNLGSLGFTCCGLKEVGDDIHFAGTQRLLTTVTVTMSDWACQSGDWTGTTGPCVTARGAKYSYPITINIYAVASGPAPGSLLATKTTTFKIPFRPSEDLTNCPGTHKWYDSVTKTCYNGLAFNIVFDFTGMHVILPNEVIFGVTYNTSNEGYHPTGVGGPYDSLNVAVEGVPKVGTDVNPDDLFLNCDNTAECASPHPFGQELGWAPYTPAVRFTAAPLPESCSVNLPDHSKEVINVEYKAINSEDYSFGWDGTWALDSMTLHIKVWQLPDGSWFALKTYDGKFFVPTGAHSPVAGTLETKDGSGEWEACYTASFIGTLAPTTGPDGSPLKTHGNIGVNDMGGTVADIIASWTIGSGSANPHYWSWLSHYFPGYTNLVYHYDIWVYTLQGNHQGEQQEHSDVEQRLIEYGIYSGIPSAIGDIIT